MAWLTSSPHDWICCIQEPYMSNRGVPRLPVKYGAFWSSNETEGNTKVRAMIILHKRMNAYQISQVSTVDEIYVYVSQINVCVGSKYCPMNSDMGELVKNVQEIRKKEKKIIICMDTNAYHPEWGATKKVMESWRQRKRGEKLHEVISEYGFCVCNEVPHLPTFVRKEGNLTTGVLYIDITLSTIELYDDIVEWEVHETKFLTDHNPIVFRYLYGKGNKEKTLLQCRSGIPWKKLSPKMHAVMCEELEKNVKYMSRVQNVEEIDRFIRIHVEEVRRVLQGVFKEKKEKKTKVYWWTEAVEEAHKKLKRARKRMRRYRHESLKEKFREKRREFRKEVNKAKTEKWKEYLVNIKTPWEGLIKIVRATEAGKIQTRTLADLEGNFGEDIQHTLEMLGKQFFPEPEPLTTEQQEIMEKVQYEVSKESGRGPKITVDELRYALTQVTKNSAPGSDQVTNNVICTLACKKYEYMYLLLFNRCLEESYFPQAWKSAKVTLIPKAGGGIDTVKAFRPISLTSVYAKLLERILLMRLQHYLKVSGRMVENQHAYRKGKSTLTALYEMFEFVQLAVNKRGGGICVIVFLDISGAFDRTWHEGILHKLIQYEVPSYMIKIIKSFLQDRSVKFEEGGSEHSMHLTQGCPQGGVLSPSLWNVLFNELLGLPMNSGNKRGSRLKIIGYADDAALVCKADTVQEASDLLNEHLKKIYDWSTRNRVIFNATKLAVLTISNRQTTVPPAAVYYNGILINEVTRYRYLGLIVDNKLNWKAHIDEVLNRLDKITRSLRGVSGMEWGLKLNVFRTLYKAIFFPVMTYGISIWGWKAAQNTVYMRFDKEIRKFGMIALRCMKTTSNVFIRSILNTQKFEDILATEVLSTSVRQFHVVHTERQSTYESYTRSIKRIEYPQCIDHHYMMCRRRLNINYGDLEFENAENVHEVHPAMWVRNRCVITNVHEAMYRGNEQSGLNIYTDASASSYSKGWSFIVYRNGFRVAMRCGSVVNCNIYNVELHAIWRAVVYVNEEAEVSKNEFVEIRTDCQAAVQSMRRYVQREKLQREINEELRKATINSKKIVIRWVPGHRDVIGNEDADQVAKRAVDSESVTIMRQSGEAVRTMLRQKRKEDVHNAWEMVSSQTKAFLPTISDMNNFISSSPSSAICQLVSGHTRLNDFICRKLKIINKATCACGLDDETITPYLFECPKYQQIRERIWPDFSAEYSYITQDWGKLQQYVNETGRFRGRYSNSNS